MEGITAEIRNKIKAAVKAKLQELGVHVDEELPDYILVMVANRRSKAQMCADLSLFLGSHTESFTDWLHLVFQKLESFATATKEPVANDESTNVVNPFHHKKPNHLQSATLLDSTEKELLNQRQIDVYEPSCVPVISSSVKSVSQLNPSEEMDDDCLNIRDEQDQETLVKSTYEPSNKEKIGEKRPLNFMKEGRTSKKSRHSTSESSPRQPSSRVGSVVRPVFKTRAPRRTLRAAEREKEKDDNDSQRHASRPRNGMPSVVRVTSRPKLPARMQANKSLILKAVAAAQKSVGLYQPKTVEPEKNPRFEKNPRPELFTRKYRERKLASPEKVPVPSIPELEVAITKESPARNETDDSYCAMDVDTFPAENEVTREYPQLSKTISIDRMESPAEIPTPPIETRFIVTLDGVHSHLGNNFESRMEEDGDNDEMEDSDASHLRRLKPNIKSRLTRNTGPENESQHPLERCKYWPSCRQGDLCTYHHPTVPCKTFPNCTFGGSCLFIHPDCKYDAGCSRKNCPFTHTIPPKVAVAAPVLDKVPAAVNGKTVCRFFPTCNNVSCTFFHPLACKFGSNCTRGGCSFYHPKAVPSVGQLKWIANK